MPSESQSARVLLADDQPDVLMALRLLLKSEGFQTEAVSSPTDLIQAASTSRFDLILMDLNYTRDTTSGDEGLDILMRLRALPDAPPAIVMTAWGSIDLAVEAMRRGAVDFVPKPWDNARLMGTLRKNLTLRPATSKSDELSIARKVQAKLFPRELPKLATLEYSGMCIEAGPVGGDYYDMLDLAPGRLGLVLADVCGKGLAAALLMSNLQATMRSHLRGLPEDWSRAIESVNMLFYQSTAPEHFATAFAGDYDDQTRTLRYINCGHNPPVLLRANGMIERLNPTAMVLGAFRRFSCQTAEARLQPGDWLILFSDGVVEAMNDELEMFGDDELIAEVRRHATCTTPEMMEAVRHSLDGFAAPAGRDDWTLVAARGI